MSRLLLALGLLAALHGSPVKAQTPNFSGTWVLDEAASRLTSDAGLGTLGAVGTPAPSSNSSRARWMPSTCSRDATSAR